jgi:hypothetical protein
MRQLRLSRLQYTVSAGTKGPFDFWAVVDDNGTGKGKETECDETNNAAFLAGSASPSG